MMLVPVILGRELPPEALVAPLEASLHDVMLWWASKGYGLGYERAQRAVADLDYAVENPWNQAFDWLKAAGYFGDERRVLALLWGWDHPTARGWGGNPLAVVGDYCLKRLLTEGTPGAIMDDREASGIMGHEVGHVLGFAHALGYPNNIMWTGLYNFPECYLPPEWLNPPAGIGTAPIRLSAFSLELTPCPL